MFREDRLLPSRFSRKLEAQESAKPLPLPLVPGAEGKGVWVQQHIAAYSKLTPKRQRYMDRFARIDQGKSTNRFGEKVRS